MVSVFPFYLTFKDKNWVELRAMGLCNFKKREAVYDTYDSF